VKAIDFSSRHAVQRILAGKQTAVIVPLDPQPRETVKGLLWTPPKQDRVPVYPIEQGGRCAADFAPWKVGQILRVREPFCVENGRIYLAADYGHWDPFSRTRWRASVHLPRKASRLHLKVEEVRLGRVQGIAPEGYMDTGCIRLGLTRYEGQIQHLFRYEWDLVHPNSLKWDRNPYVWFMRFSRAEQQPSSVDAMAPAAGR
jgi:hypothetical protein